MGQLGACSGGAFSHVSSYATREGRARGAGAFRGGVCWAQGGSDGMGQGEWSVVEFEDLLGSFFAERIAVQASGLGGELSANAGAVEGISSHEARGTGLRTTLLQAR